MLLAVLANPPLSGGDHDKVSVDPPMSLMRSTGGPGSCVGAGTVNATRFDSAPGPLALLPWTLTKYTPGGIWSTARASSLYCALTTS